MSKLRQRFAMIAATGLGLVALTGCAFTSGLLPTGGVDPNVYFAQANVLTAKRIPLLVVPECSMEPDGTTQVCKGTTMSKQPIVVTANQAQAGVPMVITVGGKEVFRGSAMEVMAKAATTP